MIEAMMAWVSSGDAPKWVLLGATMIIVIEAARVSRKTFWSDLLEEDE